MTHPNRPDVLIIDDDTALTLDWAKALSARDWNIRLCSDADKGFEACLLHWPQVIVVDGLFKTIDGHLSGSGGLLFCTRLSLHADSKGVALPYIIGVTASRPSEFFPIDVFGNISRKVMPVRLRKPVSSELLAEKIANGLAAKR